MILCFQERLYRGKRSFYRVGSVCWQWPKYEETEKVMLLVHWPLLLANEGIYPIIDAAISFLWPSNVDWRAVNLESSRLFWGASSLMTEHLLASQPLSMQIVSVGLPSPYLVGHLIHSHSAPREGMYTSVSSLTTLSLAGNMGSDHSLSKP